MSKFTVSAAEMQSAISELSSANNEFKNRVNELEAAQKELAGQWQGDANTAFNNAFLRDKGQWSAFANLVDQYISALSGIKTQYEKAEAANSSTAKSRNY